VRPRRATNTALLTLPCREGRTPALAWVGAYAAEGLTAGPCVAHSPRTQARSGRVIRNEKLPDLAENGTQTMAGAFFGGLAASLARDQKRHR
jgi:hypothetical protein